MHAYRSQIGYNHSGCCKYSYDILMSLRDIVYVSNVLNVLGGLEISWSYNIAQNVPIGLKINVSVQVAENTQELSNTNS